VQADLAGAGGDREVLGVQACALLDPGAGVQQHPDDRGVAGAATGGRASEGGLLLGVRASGSPGRSAASTGVRRPASHSTTINASGNSTVISGHIQHFGAININSKPSASGEENGTS
jgi:hypothetical protein